MISYAAQLEVPISTLDEIAPIPRILIAGEADPCRDVLAAVLCRSGYDVAIAADGADALEQFAAEEFDLLLTDWEMPVLDGGRLVLALRSARLQIPVVMLSGEFGASPLPDVISRELFAALEKPVCVFTFLSTVAAALESTLRPVLCVA